MTRGSPGQNLDSIEEIGEVPRAVGLGHDVVFQVSRDLGLPQEDHALRPVRQRIAIRVVLQTSSPGHICKLQQCLVALAVQFVKGILVLKLDDVLVSLSQNFKNPLLNIPMQQVFVMEVRDEKLGISSQSSPQEISGAQPLF